MWDIFHVSHARSINTNQIRYGTQSTMRAMFLPYTSYIMSKVNVIMTDVTMLYEDIYKSSMYKN